MNRQNVVTLLNKISQHFMGGAAGKYDRYSEQELVAVMEDMLEFQFMTCVELEQLNLQLLTKMGKIQKVVMEPVED
jgi:hypothetical protein